NGGQPVLCEAIQQGIARALIEIDWPGFHALRSCCAMSITQLLGIEHPIIQAPMVGVSTPALAAAVSTAGALGSIGIGACTPAQARAMLEETRALTSRPFNVNLFCHRPAVADAQREAAWLEYLRPLFAEFGAEPPAGIREIYKSFLADPE